MSVMDGNDLIQQIKKLGEAVYATCAAPASQVEVTLPDAAFDLVLYEASKLPGVQVSNRKDDPSMTVYGVKVWRKGAFKL